MIHFKDRAIVTADGREYPHNGTPGDRRRAIAEAQSQIALQHEASNRRSIAERGRPATPSELERGWQPDEKRGPHEIACDKLAANGAQFNPYSARLSALRASRTESREIEALESKAASWMPPAPVEAKADESPFAVAIASLLEKPGYTREEIASTERQVNALRTAEDRWKDERAREAEAKARAERPEYVNAVANGEAAHRAAELLPNVPQNFVNGAAARLKALKETGDTEAYWRDTRAAEKELNLYFDQKEAEFKQREINLAADKAAALSRLPVTPPVVEAPPVSSIEQALTPPEVMP
jgi:hypothetical protein